MRIGSYKDFFSGLMFAATGTAFAIGSFNYTTGEAARMGPGYFPLMIGVLLALFGCVVAFKGVVVHEPDQGRIRDWKWKPLVCILGANLLFGVLLGGVPFIGVPALGLVVGIYGLTIVSSLASGEFKWREVLILATALAILSYVAFVLLLRLQFQVWPSFLVD